jgi:hypothetical protein
VTIPAAHSVGDAGHTTDHNSVAAVLTAQAAAITELQAAITALQGSGTALSSLQSQVTALQAAQASQEATVASVQASLGTLESLQAAQGAAITALQAVSPGVPLTLTMTAPQTIGSTTPVTAGANATPLEVSVTAATWRITGQILYKGNQNGGIPTITPEGPATSLVKETAAYTVQTQGSEGTADLTYSSVTGLAGFTGPALVSAGFVTFSFDITARFTATGYFQVVARTSLNADQYVIQPGSWIVAGAG